MTYSRVAGTTNPTIAGYASFGSLPINDGTFKSSFLEMIEGSPDIVTDIVELPNDDGGFDGYPLYGPWKFSIEGWIYVPVIDDIQAAINDLRSVFNLYTGLGLLTFKSRGFSGTRQMTVRLADKIVITDPGLGRRKVRRRDFTLPLVAPDPRAYNADSEHSVDFASGATHDLTNNGNYPTPFTVQFVGPLTNPQLDGPGPAGSNRIRLYNSDGTDYVIASGHSVTVQTNPAAANGVTVLDETGASVYEHVDTRTAALIMPGTSSWTLTTTGGGADTGHATVKDRDAWV